MDRYEKEPLPLFLAAFLWGAIPAVLASLLAETVSALLGGGAQASEQLNTNIIAPVVEEACKGAALLLVFWLFRSEFDGVLDGIIYGSAIGFGFAMTENIIYYISAWSEGGLSSWTSLVLVRGVAFGLNHALYTAITGAALGYARLRKGTASRWLIFLLGYGAAVIIHMLHNALVSGAEACLLGFLIDWGGVLVLLLIVVLCWKNERDITSIYLQEEVSLGIISQAQYDAISKHKHIGPSKQELNAQTKRQLQVWREISRTATELAFKKHQYNRIGDEGRNGHIIASLRSRLQELNGQLAALL
ncbi:MAG: PrsW family intramembrane metalloprotease [Chloroflexi bacterium]|nr:PrsW family intramembrane metalloprotease [Chloroflexota bacterium]